MTKTAARVRHLNLYTVEQNGLPVAQAMAISQADAVRLYVESVQQPTMTARLSTPLEARTLAGLPLLSRDAPASPAVSPASCTSAPDLRPERDPRVPDMFDDAPAADHVGDAAEMVEPLAAGGFAPCGRALGDCGKATQTCGRDGCGVELAPIAAGLPAEFLSYIEGEEPAAEQSGEPAEPVALAASAPAGVAPGSSESGADDAPAADTTTHAELMASAYAAGVEIARQGHTRWSAEFLDANAAALRGLRDDAADEVHAEMLRGFEDGQPIPKRKPELKQQAEEAAARAGGKIVAKYRDPATGQTWSGRGLRPRWLVQAIEEGKTLDEFLIENQGAQA